MRCLRQSPDVTSTSGLAATGAACRPVTATCTPRTRTHRVRLPGSWCGRSARTERHVQGDGSVAVAVCIMKYDLCDVHRLARGHADVHGCADPAVGDLARHADAITQEHAAETRPAARSACTGRAGAPVLLDSDRPPELHAATPSVAAARAHPTAIPLIMFRPPCPDMH